MGFREEELPFPGAQPFTKASGLRHAYCQEGVDVRRMDVEERSHVMANLARRATDFFDGYETVQWHTLRFEVANNGTEPAGTEIWRWSVWVQ